MSRTVPVALLALFVLVTLAPAITAPASGPPTFASTLAAAAQLGEPSVLVDGRTSPPSVFTVAPFTLVYRSTNGGVSFTPGGAVNVNGDASIAMDDDGNIYVSGLTDASQLASTVPVQVSVDGGVSFIRQRDLIPGAGTGVACDRQWTAARGHGESVTSVRCGSEAVVWRTTNAGLTYQGPFTIATDVAQTGPLHYSPDGNLYLSYWDFSDARIARSSDGGLTWQTFAVAPLIDTRSFTASAADAAGNLYYAFEQSSSITGLEPAFKSRVFFTKSVNDGATWSTPRQISDEARSAIFPWVAAGAAGKVDVAFYVENFLPGNPLTNLGPSDLGLPTTTWDVEMVQSVNALATLPSFQRVVAVPGFHTGSVCTSGLSCVGPQNAGFGGVPTPFDRRALDFFEIRIDSAGLAYISYPKDRPVVGPGTSVHPVDLVFANVDMMVARQTGGTALI